MKKNKRILTKVPFIVSLFIIIMAVITSCTSFFEENKQPVSSEGALNIYCLDVGQGDSTYIVLPNGENMLIDAGERDCDILEKLEKFDFERLDYVVITHPHSDHAGGMEDVINTYDIGKLYMSDAVNSADFFIDLLDVIEFKNINVAKSVKGDVIAEGVDFKVEILSPHIEGYDDLNNMSAVIKITYKDKSFLFMGDAEKDAEADITDDVNCDFIRVGHHGSSTSSSNKFLKRVTPEYAVISVGEFNRYEHPHDEILNRYEKIGATIYRTDIHGMITVVSDGNSININTQQ